MAIKYQYARVAGIYCISNSVNGNSYVGKSIDIFNRWNQHSTHWPQYHLNRAMKKYGLEAFNYKILEIIPEPKRNASDELKTAFKETLATREQHWIDALHPVYNNIRAKKE